MSLWNNDRTSGEPFETGNIWLSLNEMTRPSVLMNIASRLWIESLEKGESYAEERINEFVDEYRNVKEALGRLLPKQTKSTSNCSCLPSEFE